MLPGKWKRQTIFGIARLLGIQIAISQSPALRQHGIQIDFDSDSSKHRKKIAIWRPDSVDEAPAPHDRSVGRHDYEQLLLGGLNNEVTESGETQS